MSGTIRTGIAGWVFPDWRGTFYPQGLVQKQELAHASRALRTIEINATFYANQKPASFLNWANETPDDFVFSVKGPKFITETRRLRDVDGPLRNFLASGPLALGKKLGPIVWQLPKGMKFDAERIANFLALLPKTPEAASAMAQEHDDRLKSPAHTDSAGVEKIRHAIEARDTSFAHAEFIAILRQHNVAMVVADTETWPYRDVTSDFVYARLQGPPDGSGAYQPAAVDAWADTMKDWADGKAGDGPLLAPAAEQTPRDVFGYFVHTDKVHAPANAQSVMARLGLKPPA